MIRNLAARVFATIAIAGFIASGVVFAIDSSEEFEDPKMQARYEKLTAELRCLVCQNQTIADSNAGLAVDLRRETRQMLLDGKTDDEIRTFMVERYGNFVLYRPPVQGNTLALWAMPVLFLFVGAIAVFVAVRKRNLKLAEQRQGASE